MISGIPSASSAAAWPVPHQTPSRAAPRTFPRSPATSEVTATRWSGSVAWRSPSARATSIATRKELPANRPSSQASTCSTGAKRNWKSISPTSPSSLILPPSISISRARGRSSTHSV